MKLNTKLLMVLPAFGLLVACSNNTAQDSDAAYNTQSNQPQSSVTTTQNTQAKPLRQYDRMMPDLFSCSDDSEIYVKYSLNHKQVQLLATLPKLNWEQQPIVLDIASKPTQQIQRYVNAVNPSITYEWRSQDNVGELVMAWSNGQTYQVECQQAS